MCSAHKNTEGLRSRLPLESGAAVLSVLDVSEVELSIAVVGCISVNHEGHVVIGDITRILPSIKLNRNRRINSRVSQATARTALVGRKRLKYEGNAVGSTVVVAQVNLAGNIKVARQVKTGLIPYCTELVTQCVGQAELRIYS